MPTWASIASRTMLKVTTWWVYEDKTVHTATVHHGYCPYCNNGHGRGAGRNERESTWHGPYASEAEAKAAPIRTNSMFRDCGSCIG